MIELVAWMLVLPSLLGLVTFTAELLAGMRPSASAKLRSAPTSAVVLVPAHNEEATIGKTVDVILGALGPSGRLLVVADNCTDATARIARRRGAEVIERNEPSGRGKGFALAFGRDFLSANPPEVAVVLDADCTISRVDLEQLVASAALNGAPVQAVDLLTAPTDAAPLVQISNFAMLVKNLLRARGLYRIGGGIPLFGTGMAFPWTVFAEAPLASGDTVEDLQLAVEFARAGIRVHFVENAKVLSPAAAARDTLSQRRRWEHGFLHTAKTRALPLVFRGIAHGSRHQAALGLHLCVPPLALLIMTSLMLCAASALVGAVAQVWVPAFVLFMALAVALASTLLAWHKYGRGILLLGALARAPLYVLAKVPLYASFFSSRQTVWNRTPRDGDVG